MLTMTQFWRRQTTTGGTWPLTPAPSTGIPFFPQIVGPLTVIGRLNSQTGPVEPIPISALATLIGTGFPAARITSSDSLTADSSDRLIVLNKAVAHTTAITLPKTSDRVARELDVFDFAGNAGAITFTPDAADTGGIMGSASWQVLTRGVRLIALPEILGWLVGGWV